MFDTCKYNINLFINARSAISIKLICILIAYSYICVYNIRGEQLEQNCILLW